MNSCHPVTRIKLIIMGVVCLLALGGLGLGSAVADTMTLPLTEEAWRSVSAPATPVVNTNPGQAKPLGFGSIVSGGETVSLVAALSSLSAAADVYVGVQADVLGSDIYLFTPSNQLVPMSQTGLVPWKSDTTGNFSSDLGTFQVSALPVGVYNFYFLLTPANRLDLQRGWKTILRVGMSGSDSVAMEEDIQSKLGLLDGLSSSFDLTSISEIFSDENVVTVSPADLSLEQIMAGTPITINANFGSSYRANDGSTWSGSAVLSLTNINFSQTGIGADIAATFNNVTQNGVMVAAGSLSGSVGLTQAADGESMNINGNMTFNNLTLNGMTQNGSISISGMIESLDTSTCGNIVLAFTSFTSGIYTIDSGTISLALSDSDLQVKADMQTSDGPVDITLLLEPLNDEGDAQIRTAVPGVVGPYTVSVNNIAYQTDNCSGSVSFTDSSGITIDAIIDPSCSGFSYVEQ